jgi:hypothetical protein
VSVVFVGLCQVRVVRKASEVGWNRHAGGLSGSCMVLTLPEATYLSLPLWLTDSKKMDS